MYESEPSSHGLRFANKASRIFIQDRRAGPPGWFVALDLFLSCRLRGAQSLGRSVICRIGGHPPTLSKGVSQEPGERQAWLLKPCRPLGRPAPIRDASEGTGDKRGRNRRRGAAPDSAQIRQSQIDRPPKPQSVMATIGLIPRARDGPAAARAPCGGLNRPQSIIAALRMQTIVAWAGFALGLRIR